MLKDASFTEKVPKTLSKIDIDLTFHGSANQRQISLTQLKLQQNTGDTVQQCH